MNASTEEQAHILDLAKGKSNILINALAGCGKTSTLEMIDRASRTKPCLYLVFNKKNQLEAETRMSSTTSVRTFNGMGHRIWAAKCGGNVKLDPKKTQTIFKSIVDESKKPKQVQIWETYWEVGQAVALAKALGYIPAGLVKSENSLLDQDAFHATLDEVPDDFTSGLIDEVLKRSIISGFDGHIDFNDQIYLPALFGGTYPQFPLVLVDEAQDLSSTNYSMVEKLVGNRRMIAVGDPFQNIYGFRGAKGSAMRDAKDRWNMTPASLSISFRCPQAIVENARWRAPQFQWIKPGGYVELLDKLRAADIPDNATIICRNNAPLFRIAFKLLAVGRSVNVSGSDIGPRLVAIMRKLGDLGMSQADTKSAISAWLDEKLSRESKTANEMAECMFIFAEHGATLGQAINYAEHLFAQTGSIRLTTGHKAKGLEWDTVYHLDPWLLDDCQQDLNLRYVIQTRSKDRYYEIDSSAIKW